MSGQPAKTTKCPTCGQAARFDRSNAFRPFCSERCKLIDLGQWASERYRIASEHDPADPKSEPGAH